MVKFQGVVSLSSQAGRSSTHVSVFEHTGAGDGSAQGNGNGELTVTFLAPAGAITVRVATRIAR